MGIVPIVYMFLMASIGVLDGVGAVGSTSL